MQKNKILLVDDVPANIDILQSILGSDHNVLCARSGNDALRIAGAERPDLVLLDVMMPDIDGYEVARQLKLNDTTAHIPIIFIAAPHEVEDEALGLEAGGVDYITKPVRPSIVQARVRNHLELQKQRDAISRLDTIDVVTGMPNAKGAAMALDQEWKRAARNGKDLSLIILDIDDFKEYSNQHGSRTADECLRDVASAIRHGIRRAGDVVASHSGGRFVCILPRTERDGAAQVADRIRRAMGSLPLPVKGSDALSSVTVSIGICSCIPRSGASADELFEAAEAMVTRAKAGGKDRTESTILRV